MLGHLLIKIATCTLACRSQGADYDSSAVDTITRELEYVIDLVYFWTDPPAVVQMINNRSQRLKSFIANHVNTIHLLSNQNNGIMLRDIASPGIKPDKALSCLTALRSYLMTNLCGRRHLEGSMLLVDPQIVCEFNC